MLRILFVCHGNICRSPMAEFVMKEIVRREHLDDHFEIASAATSSEELGNPVYPPVKKLLAERGISCVGKRAQKLTYRDYEYYDYLIGMDEENRYFMNRICKGDPESKISLLMEYTNTNEEIDDPWYTRDFEATWRSVNKGCEAFLKMLVESGAVYQ